MNHLLQVNLGPVQGFIANARRTRDLWFGSYILSEISKAVALSLHRAGASLIFPCAPNDPEAALQADEFLVANIVFAELESASLADARAVVGHAEQAARARWHTLCNQALQQMEKALGKEGAEHFYDSRIWAAQLGDVVEIYSAIVPQGSDGYAHANQRLRELMANRKNSRCFSAYADTYLKAKSSLDGALSTVLRESTSTRHRQRLGIEPAEQLDTSAMVKRVIGRERGFVPSARVAAQEWVERLHANEAHEAKARELHERLRRLSAEDQGTELKGKYAEYPWIQALPFDAQLLYRHRIAAGRARMDEAREADPETHAQLKALDQLLASIYKQLGPPNPYYGLLLADGDKMGKLIDKANEGATNSEGHRAISQALTAFAQSVPDIMAQCSGACIYSGGDDVLGLVPLHMALDTANRLQEAFKSALDDTAAGCGIPESERPTLSVGIAIVHFLEPLGDVRQLAGRAEKAAKGAHLPPEQQRNAFCLVAKPRSGAELRARIRWDDEPSIGRLKTWTRWLGREQKLPRGLPHELHEAFVACQSAIPPEDDFATFKAYWRAQLSLILNKKQAQGEDLSEDVKANLLTTLAGEGLTAQNASDFAPLPHLLMARWLSGQSPGEDE
jgi:CRISPR-associated protein Cmr2